MNWTLKNVMGRVLDFFLAVVTFLIGLRVIFELIGASPGTPFVSWIYTTSEGFVAPFRGIVPNPSLGVSGTLDLVALIALAVYAIIVYLLVNFFNIIATPTSLHSH